MRKSVIIVAGGSGLRMGSELPKQFLLLENRPVLMWTISRFIRYDPAITVVVVLPGSQIDYWKELCTKHKFHTEHLVVKGGETRFHSVKIGLDALPESDLVAVHDGVRPLVSYETIENCFSQAARTGAAIPVLPLTETLRTGTMENSHTVDRNAYYTVQTPQIFRVSLLKEAYRQDWSTTFTDDASVVEKSGSPVVMVPGNRENIKITHPWDLWLASEYLKKKGRDPLTSSFFQTQ